MSEFVTIKENVQAEITEKKSKFIANIIKEKINPNLKIKYEQLPSDDPIKRKPDITLAKKILNWEPKTTLSCGLDKTIKFFSS